MNSSCIKNIIEPSKVIEINNLFRAIGLNRKLSGTKFLNKATQLILLSGNELFVLEDVLTDLITIYPNYNKMQIRMAMKYALDNREVNEKTKENFQNIFGFTDTGIFETTGFLDEVIYALSNN